MLRGFNHSFLPGGTLDLFLKLLSTGEFQGRWWKLKCSPLGERGKQVSLLKFGGLKTYLFHIVLSDAHTVDFVSVCVW